MRPSLAGLWLQDGWYPLATEASCLEPEAPGSVMSQLPWKGPVPSDPSRVISPWHTGLLWFPGPRALEKAPRSTLLPFHMRLSQIHEYAIFAHPLQANFLHFCSEFYINHR